MKPDNVHRQCSHRQCSPLTAKRNRPKFVSLSGDRSPSLHVASRARGTASSCSPCGPQHEAPRPPEQLVRVAADWRPPETSRDGPGPLKAASPATTRLSLRFGIPPTAPKRAPTTGKRTFEGLRERFLGSSNRFSAMDVDALETISCASNLLVSRSERM